MNWYLGNYWYLLLLLLLPVIGYFIIHYIRWKNRKRNLFAENRFQDVLFEKTSGFTKLFPVLYLLGFLFLIFSIIDLLGGKEEISVQQNVSSTIFVLDVSNSMNAQDIQPSRLDEAKNIIINSLQKMSNDRVGIIVFAGDAYSVMPLSSDYSAAETYLQGIETSVIQNQGTDFLKPIQIAAQKFKNITKGSRNIVLISDGEDNEGHEDEAINLAKKQGIRVTAVGVGTEEGAPIPEYYFGQLMGYKSDMYGETVVSKLQTKALRNISSSTGGNYLDGNNLESTVNNLMDELRKNTGSSSTTISSQSAVHYYQYFLAVSVLFFFLIFLFNPKRDFNL
ncbi:VWA domain-containing protein [Epilithonimonas hominis]|uniref:Ca-activated chloride channel family protein n=1 Tax=Epilithonimonas hominis TaxID=420404 RepID=A0A1H6L1W3_9FLAO|nr:VWA domain-containing protein [Epilithonimonas hominis]SEH78129.1 Ca-activated chloride channel family protein [Epilithonimonas hominis]